MPRPAIPHPDAGVEKAIRAAGGPVAFARALGISRTVMLRWRRIPAERILQVESLTRVPREELRPDLYLTPRPFWVRVPDRSA